MRASKAPRFPREPDMTNIANLIDQKSKNKKLLELFH